MGLTERFAKTEVTINGKTVELQKYIRDCDKLFTDESPENQAPDTIDINVAATPVSEYSEAEK